MNKHKLYHQPSIIRLVVAAIALRVNKLFFKPVPIAKKIGAYTLERAIVKAWDNNFSIGIYSNGASMYFVKTWMGYFKDSNFYSLLNEYLVNKTLHDHFSCTKELTGISTPRVIELITGKNCFSVVFEYIEGKNLDTYSKDFQAKGLAHILECLEGVSIPINNDKQHPFIKRGALYYLLLLPILVVLAIVHNVEEFPTILLSALYCFKAFFSTYTSTLILAHRDIGPDNVIVSGDTYYLIDFERIALTYPLYDISSLGIEPTYSEIVSIMRNDFMYVEDEFLRLFIFIRRAAFSSEVSQLRQYLTEIKGRKYA